MGPSSCSAACGRATARRLALATGVSICGDERLGFRTTARGTVLEAYMFDAEVNFPRVNTRAAASCASTRSTKTRRKWTTTVQDKIPDKDRPDQLPAGGYQHRLERPLSRMERTLAGRFTGGFYAPNTGPGKRSGFPSTEEKFTPDQTPGLDAQPDFLRAGFTVQYDYRDLPTGPRAGRELLRALQALLGSRSRAAYLQPVGYGGGTILPLLEQDPRRRLASGHGCHASPGRADRSVLPGAHARRQRTTCEGLNVIGSMTRARCCSQSNTAGTSSLAGTPPSLPK